MSEVNLKIEQPRQEPTPVEQPRHVETKHEFYNNGIERRREPYDANMAISEEAFNPDNYKESECEQALNLPNIENILSRDLGNFYTQMSPDRQLEFKRKGEETSRLIKSELEGNRVNATKITKIIDKWLKIIKKDSAEQGKKVNDSFLTQQAKIIIDELLALKKS